jgi:hypothetical protein
VSIFDDAFNSFPSFNPVGTSGLPVFSADGTLQGNLTSAQGQAPTANNAMDTPLPLPSIGGSAGTAAGASIPQAAAAAGITGGATPPAATTGTPSASGTSSLNNWFTRAVIVILGFVFVAVGLSQFGVVQKLGR